MLINNEIYRTDLKDISSSNLNWDELKGKSVLVTGAAGLICSCIIDFLMYRNHCNNDCITIYALGRNEAAIRSRFLSYYNSEQFVFIKQDICKKIEINKQIDYIIHGASNAHPAVFASDPVGTMMSNFYGMYNVFELARKCKEVKVKVIYISSGEIYGEPEPSIETFDENYSGYVNTMNARSCYPSSKRATETLCSSYVKQFSLDVAVVRPCHIYGPTMTMKDSRAVAVFLRNVLAGQDIVMKSQGNQIRSYCYVADAVSAILTVLLNGEIGNAYNISDKNSIISIKEMAYLIAEMGKQKVIISEPTEMEKSGFTPVTRQVLDSVKLELLGWLAKTDIKFGINKTLQIFSG